MVCKERFNESCPLVIRRNFLFVQVLLTNNGNFLYQLPVSFGVIIIKVCTVSN